MATTKSGSTIRNEYKGVRSYQTAPAKQATQVVTGKVWVKKAGAYLEYTKFNKEGQSDIEKWISK